MAIEINNLPPTTPAVDNGGQTGAAQTGADTARNREAGEDTGAGAPVRDQISLTPEARRLQTLEAQLAEQPVVDSNRVDAIREALANGSFEIDAGRVAGKMMDLERALSDLS